MKRSRELGHVWQRAGLTHAKPRQMRMHAIFSSGRNPHRKFLYFPRKRETCPLRAAVWARTIFTCMWIRRLRASGDAAAKECDAATSTAPRVAFCISGLARSFATPFMLDQHWQLLVRPLAPDASDRKADHGHRIFFHLKSDRSSLSASIPTILLALERGWSRSILGEAVVLNGSVAR